MTVKEMERRVAALMAEYPSPPTFEQFTEQWFQMDELSKALFVASAECPDLCPGDPHDEYWTTIAGYLDKMGLIKNHYTIDDILRSLEDED